MTATWADATWTTLWAASGATYAETWDALDWTNLWDVAYVPSPPISVALVRPYGEPTSRIAPLTVTAGGIRNLAGQVAPTVTPLGVGSTPRGGVRSTVATGVTVAALPTSSTGLVRVTGIEASGGSITLYVVPTLDPPSVGIPVYWGPDAPTATGPWLWIDSDTYDVIAETG